VTPIRVRTATAADRDFIVGVVPRLRAFGPPPLRPIAALDGAERRALEHALAASSDDAVLFIGEADGRPTGVAHAQTAKELRTDGS
jgi:hypothetical protein